MNLSPARLVGVLLALAPSVSGQEVAARAAAPSERVYFPADYRGEVFIDVGRILECDMWDGLAPGWRGLAEQFFSDHFGYPIASLSHVRAAIGNNIEFERPATAEIVWTFRGDPERIAFPTFERSWMFGRGPNRRAVREENWAGGIAQLSPIDWPVVGHMLYAMPTPGLLVFGPQNYIRRALRNEHGGGRPVGDLVALTSAPDILAHFAASVDVMALRGPLAVLPLDWRVESDPLTHFLARLRLVEGSVHLECIARFKKGDKGPQRLQADLERARRWLLGHRQIAGLRHHWKAFELERSGQDLQATLDLGRPRDAVARLVSLVGPMWLWAENSDEVVQAAEVVFLTEPEPRRDPLERSR